MIKTKEQLLQFIQSDKEANSFKGIKGRFNIIRKYLVRLRKTEYYYNNNCKTALFISKFLLYRLSIKTGITIGLNVFGRGLYIPHYGLIVVNGRARFGDYCVVQAGVNVSENVRGGNHVYLGAGCKLMIGASIADNTIVGANAVVTNVFTEKNIVIAGVPARKISDKGFASGRESI